MRQVEDVAGGGSRESVLVDDDRRHRRRPQLRADQPEAHRPRPARARSQKDLEKAIREDAAADPRHRADASASTGRSSSTSWARIRETLARPGARLEGEDGEGAGDRRPRALREAANPALSVRLQQRRRGGPGHHRPAGRARRCGRCSPATRSATGSRRTRRTTKSTCAWPRTAASSPPTWPTST